MASWKKIIVSGSKADLNEVTASGGIITAGDLTVSGGDITLGTTSIFSGGNTTSLNNIDAIDATTEATIEAAIDTLSNLTAASSLVTVSTLDSGAISSGFGNIDIGTSTLNAGNTTVDNLTNASAVADSHITGSMTGSFTGDGSGLSGVAGSFPSTHDAGESHAATKFFVNDGASKFISGSQLANYVFGLVSGDASVAGGGALTIAADSVENSMLANMTRGTIKVGGASNAPTDLDAKTSGQILVGDGTDIASVAVSGDVTLAANGAVTIAADAVEGSMVNANVVDDSTLEQNGTQFRIKDAGVDENKLNSSVAGGGLTGGGGSVLAVGAGTGVTVNANDVAIGQSVATTANVTFATASITQDLTVGGDLTVNGTQTSVNTTNLLVEDRFILMNSGSASGDGGFIVQTESGFTGTALGWDDSAGRFGLQVGTKLAQNATAIAPDAYISSVVTSDDSNYQKNGNIRVQSGDIFIYVE